jgi:zinc/manganese transport system substrate-binding protein
MSSDRVLRGLQLLLLLLLLACPVSARGAELRVFTCEPVWAALVQELGGDRVQAESATSPLQNVHAIQARPSLIAKLRRADLLVCSGADLEVGWLPVLLRKAANPAVQPGRPGHLEVARLVPMLGVPASLDRAEGDVHPYGNPHVELDPRNLLPIARELSARLAQLDPAGSDAYEQLRDSFLARWQDALTGWEERAAPLRGMRVVTHHGSWIYLAGWLGLVEVAQLEPKPGIPPSARHLASLLEQLQREPVAAIIRSPYQSERPSAWLSERSGAPAIVLPHAPGGVEEARDLPGMYDAIVTRLLEVSP